MTKPLPDDYTIRLIDMPISVGGRISEGPDGHIDVYINARLSHAGQYRAADHEFDHWRHDDLHNGLDIRAVEGRDGHRLPPVFRARDLIPKETAPAIVRAHREESVPAHRDRPQPLSAYQRQILDNCISELDSIFFRDPIADYD